MAYFGDFASQDPVQGPQLPSLWQRFQAARQRPYLEALERARGVPQSVPPAALPPVEVVAPAPVDQPTTPLSISIAGLRRFTSERPTRQPTVGSGSAANARPSENIPMPPPAVPPESQPEMRDEKPRFSGEPRSTYDRIADFGFALAASRNPSLFGAIGEAGQAMTQADRQDRQRTEQNDQRQQELDINRAYREGQIRLAQAEADYARDPTNPRYMLALAQARRIAALGVGGSGASDNAIQQWANVGVDSEGNIVQIDRRSGERRTLEGVLPPGAIPGQERRQQQLLIAAEAAGRAAADSEVRRMGLIPGVPLTAAQEQRIETARQNAYNRIMNSSGAPSNTGQLPAAPRDTSGFSIVR